MGISSRYRERGLFHIRQYHSAGSWGPAAGTTCSDWTNCRRGVGKTRQGPNLPGPPQDLVSRRPVRIFRNVTARARRYRHGIGNTGRQARPVPAGGDIPRRPVSADGPADPAVLPRRSGRPGRPRLRSPGRIIGSASAHHRQPPCRRADSDQRRRDGSPGNAVDAPDAGDAVLGRGSRRRRPARHRRVP
ncbi:MAG: hypothetical protein BWY66_01533 [bacterium ADurb.Bin374]|nr:MAG: hypothetical protein BWY66_01533 [bacterium ADurb.Bin374]